MGKEGFVARKLTIEEVKIFLEAAPLSELAYGDEDSPARHLRRALDHPFFEQPDPAFPGAEYLFCGDAPKSVR